MEGQLDAQDLRRYVLYWDKIDYPMINGNGANIDGLPELKLLFEESTLIVSQVTVQPPEDPCDRSGIKIGGMSPRQLIESERQGQVELVNRHNAGGNGIWSIAQTGDNILLPRQINNPEKSIEISLCDSLPVCGVNTRLEELLKFKSKRRAELLRFRSAMDKLCDGIANAANKELALSKAREEIELSLLDLHRTLDESRIQKIVSSLRVFLDIRDSSALNILLPALGTAGAGLLNAPVELGALAGLGLNALMKLAIKETPKIEKLPNNLRDFAYLYELEKLTKK